MKLWDKGIPVNQAIDAFTVGRDRELDLLLAPYDVLGSIAHTIMLQSVGLLSAEELAQVKKGLVDIYHEIEAGNFAIAPEVEDVHSQVEFMLTERLGDVGKKIHSARSRNDQVLLDIKLFSRAKLTQTVQAVEELFGTLLKLSNKHKDVLMPGYTHLQVAMPSSFGLWFGAHAEGLSDDLQLLLAAFKITNQNPLGSAAGYGSSFPIDRQLTTDLLGFDRMNYNVVYAQMGRGKLERTVAMALGAVAATISRLAYDATLFMSNNFGFITLPGEYTTGSSIMPHKKNPDVFELLRGKCNKMQALAGEITLIANNLTTGYFRDMQVIKESYLEAFDYLLDCIKLTNFIVEKIEVKPEILNNDMYKYLYSVEEVNKEVLNGLAFREAYKKVGAAIEENRFEPETEVNHTHEGSLGNLCNEQIEAKFKQIVSEFPFDKIAKAEAGLLET